MKKFLTIALSTAMAFSMFASVAFGAEKELTTQDKYDALTKAGIFAGYTDGTAGLDKEMTRGQFAKVVTKLLSLEEDAAAASKYTDVTANNWAAGFIGAASKAGLMEGFLNQKGKTIFDYNGNVTVEQMAKVLVVATKLDVPATADNGASAWAKGYVDAAIKAGLIPADANFKAAATRAQLVDATYVANEIIEASKISYEVKVVDANNIEVTFSDAKDKVEKFKLEKALEANKENTVTVKRENGKEVTLKFTWTITAANKVESVKADNLKEILVTFDGEVDTKTAGNKDNYDILNKSESIKSVTVANDKKSALILLDEADTSLTNQKEATLKLSNIQNSDKTKTLSGEYKFTPIDVKTPEVKEVKGLGTKAFKVVFSEPVKKAGVFATSNFKVDGKVVNGSVEYKYPNVAIVNATLEVGTHKLTVSNVEDFSGLKVVPVEQEFTVVEDTEAPQIVAATTNDLKEVTLEFNETVKSVEKVYHNATVNGGTIKEVNDNKVTVTFSNPMNMNENTIYVEGVVDYSGNKANRDVKVTPTLDTERPTVAKAEIKQDDTSKNHKLVIDFNKSVDKASAETASYYTLKNSDGKVATADGLNADGHPVTKPVYDADKKTVTINLASKLSEGTYTLEVNSVKDTAYVPNTMLPFTTTVKASVAVDNGIARAWLVKDGSENNVYVQYKKAVKTDDSAGSATDKAKYIIGGVKLNSEATVVPVAGDTVRITTTQAVSASSATAATYVEATLIQDIDGKYITTESGSYVLKAEIGENNVKVVADSVKATSREQVEVKFAGKLTSVDRTDFRVKVAGNVQTPTSASLNSDGTIVYLDFKDSNKLPSDFYGAVIYTVVQANIGTQDAFGSKIKAIDEATPVAVADKVIPEIDTTGQAFRVVSATEATYYDITFKTTEIVTDKGTADLTQMFKVKIGDEDAVVNNVTVEGTTIKLSVKANASVTVTNDTLFRIAFDGAANKGLKAIVDRGDNALKEFTEGLVYGSAK